MSSKMADIEAISIIETNLFDALKEASKNSRKEIGGELCVKAEYIGEKRKFFIRKPVKFTSLALKVKETFGRTLVMYYTLSNSEIIVAVQNQQDLDQAISLVEKNSKMKSLRLICSKHAMNNSNLTTGDTTLNNVVNTSNRSRQKMSGDFGSPKIGSGGFPISIDSPGISSTSYSNIYQHYRHPTAKMSTKSSLNDDERITLQEAHIRDASTIPDTCSNCSSRLSVGSRGNSYDISPINSANSTSVRIRRGGAKSACSEASEYQDLYARSPSRYIDDSRLGMQCSRCHKPCTPGSATMNKQHSHATSSSSSSGLVPDFGSDQDSRCRCCAQEALYSATISPRTPTNWRQGRLLGTGAYGQVFLGYDADTSREFAIKRVFLNAQSPVQAKEVIALENEIMILKNLQHDNIVQYIGCQRMEDHLLCIFMEFMAGGSVKSEIEQYGPLTESVVHKYTKQILRGLSYLHNTDIVHRDIKSANILRDGCGNVKISDFGSGKRLQSICSQSGAMTFIGTPQYMAPEVIEGERYGRKADIWSLACTLVEMLTGNPPWHDLEPMAAVYKIANHMPEYKLPNSLSNNLVKLIDGLFIRTPSLRPSADQTLKHPYLR